MLYVVSAPSSIPSPSPHPKSVRIRGSIDLTLTPRAAAVVAASNVYCPEMCSLCSCRRRRRFGGFQGLPTRGNTNMAVRFVNALVLWKKTSRRPQQGCRRATSYFFQSGEFDCPPYFCVQIVLSFEHHFLSNCRLSKTLRFAVFGSLLDQN